MTASATPFSFNDFETQNVEPIDREAQPRTYTQADLDLARATARSEALSDHAASEATRQTALLERILDKVSELQEEQAENLDRHRVMLTEKAREVTTHIAQTARNKQACENALTLLDRYLAEINAHCATSLILSDTATAQTVKSLTRKIEARGHAKTITIVQSSDLSKGDISIEWDDGAMAQNTDTIEKEITKLFNIRRTSAVATDGKDKS